jgi:DNA topoisomerase I
MQLTYVSDSAPGYTRRRAGRGFIYLNTRGARVRDPVQLARIRSLAIPPAYEDVWICPSPFGHIQATAVDARGRKQYLYHRDWRATRDASKFERLTPFGAALPRLRRKVARDLTLRGLPRERVLAAVVRLLDRTAMRVGNEEYVRDNGSYGLTTLRNHHIRLDGEEVRLAFRGKGGITHNVSLKDERVAHIVRHCMEIPGRELFQYVDARGARHPVTSQAVNTYLRDLSGESFTAKDYRTWTGSVIAFDQLRKTVAKSGGKKRRITAALTAVSGRLGNTPAVCRKSYVHPQVLEAEPEDLDVPPVAKRGLNEAERRLLAFLTQR